ncbi:MAG TPA: AAA family ATPase [bacterium]|nr:AAA family ATPase [bacterium]
MSPKKKKKTKPKPLDLKLTLENFGPLRKAEIDLKPLTIFIGPNNSGKTYVATMFYSLWKALQIVSVYAVMPARVLRIREKASHQFSFSADPSGAEWFKSYDAFLKSLAPDLIAFGDGGLDIAGFLSRFFPKLLDDQQELLRKNIAGQIGTSFSTKGSDLARSGQKRFQLLCRTRHLDLKYDSGSDVGEIRIGGNEKLLHALVAENKLSSICDRIKAVANDKHEADLAHDEEIAFLLAHLARTAQFGFWHDFLEAFGEERRRLHKREFHYLPAPRSALLEVYKPLVSGVFRQMGEAGHERSEIPTITGVTSNFMTFLTHLPQPEGPFAKMEIQMSDDLIQGRIVLEVAHPNLPPTFLYEFEGGKIPLYRASSSVSELAPLFLYLRYAIKPGDALIIDEPEAHLHPANIRVLAKYLVKLVREGVNLIITTHSDYLFGQINNYILRGELRAKRFKEKSDDLPDVYLNHDEVGAYLFKRDNRIKKGTAYRTEELEVTEEGFSEQEFVKVSHAMYDELVDLRRQIDPKEYLDDEW